MCVCVLLPQMHKHTCALNIRLAQVCKVFNGGCCCWDWGQMTLGSYGCLWAVVCIGFCLVLFKFVCLSCLVNSPTVAVFPAKMKFFLHSNCGFLGIGGNKSSFWFSRSSVNKMSFGFDCCVLDDGLDFPWIPFLFCGFVFVGIGVIVDLFKIKCCVSRLGS